MEEFFSSVYIVSPAVRFLCNPDAKWNRKRKYTGRVLVYLFLLSTLFYKLSLKEKNCFELLNVTPFSSFDLIRKSFKTVAFNLHPDRNPSSTAMAEYSDLVEKYKHISSPENHYKYTRFFDVSGIHNKPLKDISVRDLLTMCFLRHFLTLAYTFFLLLANGEKIFWHPLFLYSFFMMFLDSYLRLSDELLFTTKLPFIRYYVTFEVLMFFRYFRCLFIHHSSMYPSNERLPLSVGSKVLRNNVKVIESLDSLMNKFKRDFKLTDSDFKRSPDESLEKMETEMSEFNKVSSVYPGEYSFEWSEESKKACEKLADDASKFTNEYGTNLLSFLLTGAMLLMTLK